MIDALALAALARAVDHDGDVDVACAAIGRGDPMLRAAARRRVRAAHADALLAARDKHADGGRHVLRLAYLSLARALPDEEERHDVAAVTAAFDAARALRPAPSGFWWPTALVVIALAAGAAAGIMFTRLDGSRSPAARLAERPAPPARGAFATGGVPEKLPGDAVIRRVLSHDVPDYLIALDRYSEAKRTGTRPLDLAEMEKQLGAAHDKALDGEARGALGEGAGRALDALLAAARAAAVAPAGDTGDAADEALAEATSVLDDELAAAGAGYFVDGDVIHDGGSGRRLAIAYAFAVERVNLFSAAGDEVRALQIRRIDRLNWSHTLLGFTRPHLRAALVLLDQLEEQVLTLIAPGLAPGASVRLFDKEATSVPAADRAAVEARAGELCRTEYGAIPGLDAAAASKLGETLSRRRALLETLEKRAEARGLALVVPGKLRLSEGFTKSITGLATAAEIADLEKIDEALSGEVEQRTFTMLRDALAASVERHEVQHRLDARRSEVMPKALADRVGPLRQNGRERRHAVTARAELSAYLSELARDPRTVRVGLSAVARFLFDRHLHGSPECYAALVILEGVADALGVPRDAPLVTSGKVDRSAVSRLYLGLAAQPPERLRAAAKRLWEDLFAAPLADLRASTTHP
ncbi:hypothetical protein A7982_12759 [Minicystis rosea]|nr:hypothetical protein A7982_12759 [Minicystis rosea]